MTDSRRLTIVCPCGTEFPTNPSNVAAGRKYCSMACRTAYGPRKMARYRGRPVPPPVPCVCQTCGIDFEVTLSRKIHNGAGTFCSRACHGESLRGIQPAPGATTKHGMHLSAEYRSWKHLRERCTNPNNKAWHNYGGRGITVCPEWADFAAFYADMGPRPGPGYSIDRIDNNGNYEPGNCRWATALQQVHNRRPRSEWTKR